MMAFLMVFSLGQHREAIEQAAVATQALERAQARTPRMTSLKARPLASNRMMRMTIRFGR